MVTMFYRSFDLSRVLFICIILMLAASPAMANCQASANANAGDEVTVLAILHTTDPNENGEGEPLAVTISNGGGAHAFSDYETTHSYIFTAAATAPVTAVGVNVGFDGDESCEISVAVNAKHRFTQTQKNVLIGVTGGMGTASGLSWTLAEACTLGIITAPICSLPAGLTAAVTATIAAAAGTLLLIDPIDLNFMVIPVPEPATFTPVVAGNGLTQADAAALNAWLTTEAKMIGVLRATITSVNRAAGAASVGDTFWEQKQAEAINGFMSQFGALMTEDANAREAIVALLALENFPVATITNSQVLNFEARLASLGWSANQLTYLHQIGNDDAFIEAMRPLIFTQDINQVAGKIPAAFANQTLITALRQGGVDLTGAPDRPTGLAAVCNNASQVKVSWQSVPGATSYYLRINDPATSNLDYSIDSLSQTTYTANVTPGHEYQWWVHAANATGLSASAQSTFTSTLR